ncbi:hypothetical protein SEA_CHASER_99 [Mycobacterium phage Chaser]|nr:hypothetical protein SEA_CHASER_99 [Mycobacterium phage Chaser]
MKPVAQPNLLHQIVLGHLVDNKQVYVPVKDGQGYWRGTLANNVSAENVDLAARRWIK